MGCPKTVAGGLSAVILAVSAFPASGEVVLVENNKSVCTIVTGKDDGLSRTHSMARRETTLAPPAKALEFAANDLAEYLNEIGWIGDPAHTVKIVKEAREAKTRHRILLGSAAIEEHKLGEEASKISYSGYIYRTVGNDLLIFGRTSKGTANGVYGFLQAELGVRWFGPQELFTVVPRMDNIVVGATDKLVEPSFMGSFGLAGREEDAANPWSRRMRLAEPGDRHSRAGIEPFTGASHNVPHIISADKYFDEHPEYFIMRNGKRWRHPDSGQQSLCWTNPDVIEKAAEAAKAHFRQGAHYHSFSLAIPDADSYCECAECVKLQPERFYRGRSPRLQRVASDMYFHFVNEVAKNVKAEFPDRYLGVIAYNDVSAPPLGDVEDNVFVQIVLDVSEHFDEDVKRQDEELIKDWAAKNITLGMYYYTGLAKLVPAYFPHRLAQVLKEIHAAGFRGLRAEVYPGWPWTGPMVYVDARLWWDVTLDVDALLDEYFTKLYGAAAPCMSALYDLFEEIHMRPRKGGFLYEHYNFAQFRPYTGEDLARMRELIADAHGAITRLGTDRMGRGRANIEERRLAYTTSGLRLFLDMLEGVVIARTLEGAEIRMDNVGALEALEKIERLNTLLARHEQVYREAIIQDPFQSFRYRWDTCTPVRAQWKEYLSRVAGETLVKICNGVAASTDADARVNRRLDSAATEYCGIDSSGEALLKLGTGEWRLEGSNLIANPGFEEQEGRHPHYPEHLEWRPSGADNWAYWQTAEVGAFTVSEEVKRSGKYSGHIEGVGSGTLIGLAPDVRAGEYYYLEVYVNNLTEPEDGVEVTVAVDWLDGENRWLRNRLNRRVEGFGDWTKVDAVIQAPENAAAAVVMLSVGNLPSGAGVYLDDVSFGKIGRSKTAI